MEMLVPLAVFVVFAVVIVQLLPSPRRPAPGGRGGRRLGGPPASDVLGHAAASHDDTPSSMAAH